MSPSRQPGDRYEPLPGFLALPGFLIRKLGPRGRRIFWAVAGLVVAGLVVAAVMLVPEISDSKREREARERREAAAAQAARRRALIAEQRPRRAETGRADGPAERAAVVVAIERLITRDARGRVRSGALSPPAPRYTTCEPLPDSRGSATVTRLSCTAVTSEILQGGERAGLLGYPYRAKVDFRAGRVAWCKTAGRPGEGSYIRRAQVRLPRACGG